VSDHAGPPPDDGPGDAAASGPGAWRLTFEYDGDAVRLVDRRRVQMLAPPDDTELVQQGRDGFWVEVRGEDGEPLYRQVLHRPVQREFEVHSPDPGATPRHVAAPRVRGVFQAVVPDLPGGAAVAVQGAGSEAEPPGARKGRKARPSEAPPGGATSRTLAVASLRDDDGPDGGRDGRR
jgi:hypothetical protein